MSWAARNLAAYIATGPIIFPITPNTGALSLAGKPASKRPIVPGTGALTLTPAAPILDASHKITPGTGALNLTGQLVGGLAAQSNIISREYVGDGASTRSFNSFGYIPLFVIVVGKDGSGNTVGALKNAAMPTTESQPFEEGVASGGAHRHDRIISIDANGFTVGPDLNVTGRNYAYVMFPAGRFGAVTTGNYTGNTVGAPGHATLNVAATTISGLGPGSTQFVQTQYCNSTWWHPSGSTPYTPGTPLVLGGRRIIRDSDSAVVAEVTGFINQSSANGVGYILGSIAAWHWEEQLIELHTLVPDLLLLMSDDDPGIAIPATVAPPPTNSMTGWSGNNIGDPGFFASNTEPVLHIPDTNGLSYNSDGKKYHWLALKGGAGDLKMKTFQYTGTGDQGAPIDFTGCGFDPEWVYLFRAGDLFHWSKRTTNIIGLHNSRRWNDGQGDHIFVNPAYTVDFITDGVQFPATNSAWNVLGNEYTILCIGVAIPAEVISITPAAGALTITGKTPVVREFHNPRVPFVGTLQFTGQLAKILKQIRITVGTALGSGSAGGGAEWGGFEWGEGEWGSDSSGPQSSLNLVGQQARVEIAIGPIKPGTGSLSLVGKTPVISTPAITRRITPKTASLIFTLKHPTVRRLRPLIPKTGKLSLTGKAAKTKGKGHPITPGTAEEPPTGGIQIIGRQPVLKIGIKPGTGALSLTGRTPFVRPPDIPVFTHTGALNLVGQQPRPRITITPNTGALVLDGEAGIIKQSIPPRTTTNTGVLGLVGQQPILETSLIPETGELQLPTFNTEPIVERNVQYITPIAGNLSISGVSPATNPIVIVSQKITPNTGALNLVGQQPIVQTGAGATITPNTGSLILTGQTPIVLQSGGSATITPGCGALNLVGQRCRIRTPQPPIPPTPGPTGGGIGLPTPRKLPFWPKTIVRATGRIIGPPAVLQGWARVEENEMALFDD